MVREDISSSINGTPDKIRQEILEQCGDLLELANLHLPQSERVLSVSSAAPNWHRSPAANSLLLLTERRLIFVAPSPQVIAFSLSSLTKAQVLDGPGIVGFLVDGDAGSFQLGIDGQWGVTFESHVKQAAAVATLQNTQ